MIPRALLKLSILALLPFALPAMAAAEDASPVDAMASALERQGQHLEADMKEFERALALLSEPRSLDTLFFHHPRDSSLELYRERDGQTEKSLQVDRTGRYWLGTRSAYSDGHYRWGQPQPAGHQSAKALRAELVNISAGALMSFVKASLDATEKQRATLAEKYADAPSLESTSAQLEATAKAMRAERRELLALVQALVKPEGLAALFRDVPSDKSLLRLVSRSRVDDVHSLHITRDGAFWSKDKTASRGNQWTRVELSSGGIKRLMREVPALHPGTLSAGVERFMAKKENATRQTQPRPRVLQAAQ